MSVIETNILSKNSWLPEVIEGEGCAEPVLDEPDYDRHTLEVLGQMYPDFRVKDYDGDNVEIRMLDRQTGQYSERFFKGLQTVFRYVLPLTIMPPRHQEHLHDGLHFNDPRFDEAARTVIGAIAMSKSSQRLGLGLSEFRQIWYYDPAVEYPDNWKG